MSNVKRVYVEKKAEFAVQAKELRHEIRSYLGIETVTGVRVLIRYDVENLSEDTFEKACNGIFAEPPVDVLYLESFPGIVGCGAGFLFSFMMDYTNDGGITAIEIKALGILLLLIAVFCFVLFSVYRVSLKKAEKIVNLN